MEKYCLKKTKAKSRLETFKKKNSAKRSSLQINVRYKRTTKNTLQIRANIPKKRKEITRSLNNKYYQPTIDFA